MSKSYAILPCNGLDKCAGCITHEIAINLSEMSDSEIICPVFYRVADAKYNRIAQEKPVLVLDGCATRCASKLASEKGLKIAEKINISEEAKTRNINLGTSLRINDEGMKLSKLISEKLLYETEEMDENAGESVDFPTELSYQVYKKDKFVFRVPDNKGFYFNENDVWVYIDGNKARLGVTDFVQKSLSDIMFFTPPNIGTEVEQFEEVGDIESGKAVFEIVSPVSGTITAINENLINAPEMINQNPYEQGWIAEIELSDFGEDKDLIHDFDGYFSVLKRKVDEFHV